MIEDVVILSTTISLSLSNWLIQFVVVVSPSPVSQTLVVGPNTLAVVFRILCVSLLSMLKYS